MAFTILGIDDSINTCDCCGKSNLKSTVIVQDRDNGEILHYGSVCATRHTSYTTKQISGFLKEIEKLAHEEHLARLIKAESAWKREPANIAYKAAMNRAHAARLLGKDFYEATRTEREASRVREQEIISEFGVDVVSLM